MTTACFVTGYINVDDSYRGAEQYMPLGRRMVSCGQPTVVFLDKRISDVYLEKSADVVPYSIEECWLYPYRNAGLPKNRHPVKDNALRMATCCEKTSWIVKALDRTDAELLVWMDFGILHIQDIQPEHLMAFYSGLLSSWSVSNVMLGSIWPLTTTTVVDHESPCWYCAGGGLIVPRQLAEWFDDEVKSEMRRYIARTGKITWEMNIWAEVVKKNPSKFLLWRCDHNRTLFSESLALYPVPGN